MPQFKEYKLQNFGIEPMLELRGSLRILRNEIGLPLVFLIDENHDNSNNCIDKNIEDAKELIVNAEVVLIGVESLAGGKEWSIDDEDYCNNDFNGKFYKLQESNWKNNCTKFADELSIKHKSKIFGVESMGMMEKIEIDALEGNPYFQRDISTHPLNKVRSKHFIQTLFEHYNLLQTAGGNLILNCGRNHNTDIEEWIESGEIDAIAGYRANYLRLNSIVN